VLSRTIARWAGRGSRQGKTPKHRGVERKADPSADPAVAIVKMGYDLKPIATHQMPPPKTRMTIGTANARVAKSLANLKSP